MSEHLKPCPFCGVGGLPRAFRPDPMEVFPKAGIQCAEAGVPYFFKQWGGLTSKAGGYLLDGVEHREYPEGGTDADEVSE